MVRAITLDEVHELCVELPIESTKENRSRAIRALSLVNSVRLDAEMGMVKVYRVQSQSDPIKRYAVLCAPTQNGQSLVCSCPDFMEKKGHKCKHMIAVLMFLKREAQEIARREQERIAREFEWFMTVDQQNWKETHLQSLDGLSACNAQADGREGER
jgi:hypothetical protein